MAPLVPVLGAPDSVDRMNRTVTPTAQRRAPWRAAGWTVLGALGAALPFAVALLLPALSGSVQLRPSLHPVTAAAVLLLGVPLWFVVAEALAAALRRAIRIRGVFIVADAVCGLGLLVILFSTTVVPFAGAVGCAVITTLVWMLLARPLHRTFARARRLRSATE